MSSDEPEYLKAIKRNAAQKRAADVGHRAAEPARSVPSPAEREATRWAKEVGGREVRISPSLAGAKVAILVQPITPFGTPPITLEGLPSREALAERVRAAQGAGENVLGCFELTTGRPLTPELAEGKVSFAAGAPRQIMKPESPERMIRIAAKQAADLAKSRKLDDRDRGGRGSGGRR